MENERQRGGEAGAGTVRRGRGVSRWLQDVFLQDVLISLAPLASVPEELQERAAPLCSGLGIGFELDDFFFNLMHLLAG